MTVRWSVGLVVKEGVKENRIRRPFVYSKEEVKR